MTQRGRRKSVQPRTAVSSLARTVKRLSKKAKALCLFFLGYAKELAVAIAAATATAVTSAIAAAVIGHYVPSPAPPVMERRASVPTSVRVETKAEVTSYGYQP